MDFIFRYLDISALKGFSREYSAPDSGNKIKIECVGVSEQNDRKIKGINIRMKASGHGFDFKFGNAKVVDGKYLIFDYDIAGGIFADSTLEEKIPEAVNAHFSPIMKLIKATRKLHLDFVELTKLYGCSSSLGLDLATLIKPTVYETGKIELVEQLHGHGASEEEEERTRTEWLGKKSLLPDKRFGAVMYRLAIEELILRLTDASRPQSHNS